MEEESKPKSSLNTIIDGKVTKPRDKHNRNRLAASATEKLDDPEWRCALFEAGRQYSGGRRMTGRVISLKKTEKKDDQGGDKKDDSLTAMDISLD